MIVFDTSALLLTIQPTARAPLDPRTNQPLTDCKERVDYFIERLSNSGTRILIPTPVLAEFLVKAGPSKSDYIDWFGKQRAFTLEAFDVRAAIELAELIDADLQSGKSLSAVVTKAKLKFDRQITAIGKVNAADRICTDDIPLGTFAERQGIKPVYVWDLERRPPPPAKPGAGTGSGEQTNLFTEPGDSPGS